MTAAPSVRNLISLWARGKPDAIESEHESARPLTTVVPHVGDPRASRMSEKWQTMDDVLRVVPAFVAKVPAVIDALMEDHTVLSNFAASYLPLVCGGRDVLWSVGNAQGAQRNHAQTLVALHVCLHAMSQPVLEDFQGPLVIIIATSSVESAKWSKSCHDCGAIEVGLIVHDTASGSSPAIPSKRRADIAIGTASSLQQWFASKHFTKNRLSLVIADHPDVAFAVNANRGHDTAVVTNGLPDTCQRVLLAAVDPSVLGSVASPAGWSAFLRQFFGTSPALHLLAVQTSHMLPDTNTKRARAEASDEVLVWNVRVPEDAAEDEVECLKELEHALGPSGNNHRPPTWVACNVDEMLTWSALADMFAIGCVGRWPPSRGALIREVKLDEVRGRLFNGGALYAVHASSCVSIVGTPAKVNVSDLLPQLPDTLLLRNVASPDELRDATLRQEIIEDIQHETESIGYVLSVNVWVDPSASGPCLQGDVFHDSARLYVVFKSPVDALDGYAHLHGRQFDGKVVHCTLTHSLRVQSSQLAPTFDVGIASVDPLELMV